MFVEFHDLNGNDLFVNFGAVLWVEGNVPIGSTLVFTSGKVLSIKETITDIKRNFQMIAMQNQISGRQM